jgi:hypothetical protein
VLLALTLLLDLQLTELALGRVEHWPADHELVLGDGRGRVGVDVANAGECSKEDKQGTEGETEVGEARADRK